VYTYLEQVASALYVYISREQVQTLAKMGILMEFLADVLASDVRRYKIDLHQSKIKEKEMAKSLQAASTLVGGMPGSGPHGAQGQEAQLRRERERKKKREGIAASLKQKPYQQARSKEFFRALQRNEVLKCLDMVKQNPALVHDCDEERKTPLHWACQLDLMNLVQILVDFNANMNAKDDFARKPIDEALTFAQAKSQPVSKAVQELYEQHAQGTLRRNITKYDQPLYVKYLTPVEQVKELADFISRVNDMSTLTQKQRDAKAAEEARQRELERRALKKRGPKFGGRDAESSSSSSSSGSDEDSDGDVFDTAVEVGAQVQLAK